MCPGLSGMPESGKKETKMSDKLHDLSVSRKLKSVVHVAQVRATELTASFSKSNGAFGWDWGATLSRNEVTSEARAS